MVPGACPYIITPPRGIMWRAGEELYSINYSHGIHNAIPCLIRY